MRDQASELAATLERPAVSSNELRWDRIRAARAKIRRGDYDFDPKTKDLPAGICLVEMLRDVLEIA